MQLHHRSPIVGPQQRQSLATPRLLARNPSTASNDWQVGRRERSGVGSGRTWPRRRTSVSESQPAKRARTVTPPPGRGAAHRQAGNSLALLSRSFSVATRLPPEFRVSPADAALLLEDEVFGRMTVHDLPQAEQLPMRYGLRVEPPAELLATVKKKPR